MHDPGVKKGGILAALFACPNAQAVQEALPNFKQKGSFALRSMRISIGKHLGI